MYYSKLIFLQALFFATTAICFGRQEPANTAAPQAGGQGPSDAASNAAALKASKQDPAAVARGATVFAANCAGCHGPAAKGGPGAPDLVRSLLVPALSYDLGRVIWWPSRLARRDAAQPEASQDATSRDEVSA